ESSGEPTADSQGAEHGVGRQSQQDRVDGIFDGFGDSGETSAFGGRGDSGLQEPGHCGKEDDDGDSEQRPVPGAGGVGAVRCCNVGGCRSALAHQGTSPVGIIPIREAANRTRPRTVAAQSSLSRKRGAPVGWDALSFMACPYRQTSVQGAGVPRAHLNSSNPTYLV